MGKLTAAIKSKEAQERKRVLDLENQIRQLEETIKQLRAAKMFAMPIGKGAKAKRGDAFIRVVVGDTHGSALDGLEWGEPGKKGEPRSCKISGGAAKAFLEDLEFLRPAEVVHLGDVVEAGAFLASHHAWGYVHECTYTWVEDQLAANCFLNEAQARTRDAEWYLTEGNHDRRPEIWCIDQVGGNYQDAVAMVDREGTRALLHIKERGIKYIGSTELMPGEHRPGVLKLGRCRYTHGSACGMNAAKANLDAFSANVCFGHTHRIATAAKEIADSPHIQAWSFGALCERRRMWQNGDPSNWQNGYGIQVVDCATGRFQTIQIGIIDGQSLLPCLVGHFRSSSPLVKRGGK
jgi:predicted phosphodiesterase